MRAILLILSFLAAPASSQSDFALAQADAVMEPWVVGQEREVRPGNYVTLLDKSGGWSFWKFDEDREIVCVGVKQSEGKADLVPIGVGQNMFGSGPYLWVAAGRKSISSRLFGSQQSTYAKYRLVGQRYWTDENVISANLGGLNDVKIEVNSVSYREPTLHAGAVEEQGVIDLAGHTAMRSRAAQCARTKRLK